jgi:DNA-binding protein H-NS
MQTNFETMPLDDLWELYNQIGRVIAEQMTSEKRKLEQRLSQLQGNGVQASPEAQRRPYPKVYPKYQNPDDPSQTWSGRGKKPHWINDRLEAGKSIEELLINEGAA